MNEIKKEFQIFENYKNEYGKDLIYLDSAATSLTPKSVLSKMNEYYSNYRSNVNRASSKIAEKATNEFEKSREKLAKYLNSREEEIIWTSGATASSNLLIDLISLHDDEFPFLDEGDEILTTIMEHHSSLLPLQKLAKNKKMELVFLELDSDFNLDISNLENLVSEKTKIVSITLASNVLGTINNIKEIVREIKKKNDKVFVICDMTAGFGHFPINMNEMEKYIDAAYFSFHKAFGPTGVGVLWLKREISRQMNPTILGGGIVSHVEREKTDFRSDAKVFEAGTPNIAGIIGAGEAVDFLNEISLESLSHSQKLVEYFLNKISEINSQNKNILEIKPFAALPENNSGTVSMQVFVNGKEIHPHDVAEVLAGDNVAVRAGHHCAEPLVNYLGTKNGFARVSFHIYNSKEDVDVLTNSLLKIGKVFNR
ncbi:putative cysteine desulfurase [bioreactor metagenome]|uniref:cysteine desulfurase n=1 Tax=bioreactor metagenome TaxID=1076179 RepID=A0A644T8F4_9ZZZZ|nr:aminotransferase class V-fold PLP-dependent enzyme [Candidatus Elulimicrobiales bacterium]